MFDSCFKFALHSSLIFVKQDCPLMADCEPREWLQDHGTLPYRPAGRRCAIYELHCYAGMLRSTRGVRSGYACGNNSPSIFSCHPNRIQIVTSLAKAYKPHMEKSVLPQRHTQVNLLESNFWLHCVVNPRNSLADYRAICGRRNHTMSQSWLPCRLP